MSTVLLIQLPIPQLNYGRQTGNIPLAGACLKTAAEGIPGARVEMLPESVVSYLGDAALLDWILSRRPDVVGFTVYAWNVERALHLARILKRQYGPEIIFGGPEITRDNELIRTGDVDFFAYGEGEAVFKRYLREPDFRGRKDGSEDAGAVFKTSPSPYLKGLLEPKIENMMLLETQRGCPYRCGCCYYNKSRKRLSFADEEPLLESVRWAIEQGIPELYLLDPSLNARPGLKSLLKKIAGINPDGRLSIISEIRAEGVDAEGADLFARAGFAWFEIGLQSTNPRALKLLNRPTNLKRFLQGVRLLKEREIQSRIDLIAGLPGDDPEGFRNSVDFVAEHELEDDVQVFPLSVLPGSDFRKKSLELGLNFDPSPPYTIIDTPTFSSRDMWMAMDYAEVRFDVALHPLPDLDASWRPGRGAGEGELADHVVELGGKRFISKLKLFSDRSREDLETAASRLTAPYQIIVGPSMRSRDHIREALEIATTANPFTPLEIIFLEPEVEPDARRLLSAARLRRPHFLDGDLRFLYPDPGNRAILFTLASRDPRSRFSGEMKRQIYWWKRPWLPDLAELERLSELDGLLIDMDETSGDLFAWQDANARHAHDLIHITFAETDLQKRWIELTASDRYP